MKAIIKKALNSTKESKHIEFKSAFNCDKTYDWCEIIKDIAAIANSGGGVIVFGVDNNGNPTGDDVNCILKLDPATITNKISTYIGTQFSDFEISEVTKESNTLAILEIGSSDVPIIFTKPGSYPIEGGKQSTSFSRGTVYFRHGAKSELGISDDFRQVVDRRLEDIRKQWINGVQRVVRHQ
jgi:predicted HTH transcriptional regulator